MDRIAPAWLTDPNVVRVMSALASGGARAWFVGGCVRDAVIGREASDIDIATDARPEAVIEMAGAAGLRAVPTGIDHGTVTLVADRGFEVTTLRKDVETDGRRAVVAFSTDLAEDARRRDFTMNALYALSDGALLDPLQGLPDLMAGRVRFIGSADARIREDYLRSLRFFRFTAWFGDPSLGPDPEALAAIGSNIAGLETVSSERVTTEFLKLLSAPDPSRAVATMAHAGVLAAVLPGSDHTALAPLIHIEGGSRVDPLRRLGVLGGDPVGTLRLSRDDARKLTAIRDGALSDWGSGELGYRLGRDTGRSALLVRGALLAQPQPGMDALEAGARAIFPVRAADLAPLEGAGLGARLKELEARWIASDFAMTRQELLDAD